MTTEDKTTYRKWVYSPKEDAKIIDFAEGDNLPKGWYDSPADFPKKKPAKKAVKKNDNPT